MKTLLCSSLLLCATLTNAQVLRTMEWDAVDNLAGQIVTRDGRTALELSRASKAVIPLLTLDVEDVSAPVFGLRGEVSYQGLEREYLEIWVTFEDGSRYFSRTQADEGPSALLDGDSDWRPLLIPFSAEGSDLRPTRIELNASPPSPGTLWIGPLELVQAGNWQALHGDLSGAPEMLAPHSASTAWWGDDQSGLIGGIAGAALGVLGAVFGVLTARGRARTAAMAFAGLLALLGLLALGLGLYALTIGQPYAVWYPLILGGGIGLVIGLWGRFLFRSAHARHEMRRMQAHDRD